MIADATCTHSFVCTVHIPVFIVYVCVCFVQPIAEKYRNEVSICYMDKKYPGAVQQLERAGITVGEFGFVLEKGSDTVRKM